jgi:hypothetical protein
VNKIGKPMRVLVSSLVAIFVLLGAIGCGGHDNAANANVGFDDQAQTSCVAELSQDEINDAQRKLNDAQAQGLANPSVGVDEVCTINPNTGDVHYHHNNDGFRDYLLYAAFTGRASSFGSMYMLSGGSLFDAMLIDHFIGVNQYGNAFYPYGGYDGGYRRAPQPIKNVTVTNVYVGNGTSTKMSYADSVDPQKSAKYGVKPTVKLPKSSDVDGEGALTNNGKPVSKVAPVPGKSGHKDAEIKPIKKPRPNTSVVEPAKKGTSGGSSSTGAGKTDGSSSTPKSQAPAPTKKSAPATVSKPQPKVTTKKK